VVSAERNQETTDHMSKPREDKGFVPATASHARRSAARARPRVRVVARNVHAMPCPPRACGNARGRRPVPVRQRSGVVVGVLGCVRCRVHGDRETQPSSRMSEGVRLTRSQRLSHPPTKMWSKKAARITSCW